MGLRRFTVVSVVVLLLPATGADAQHDQHREHATGTTAAAADTAIGSPLVTQTVIQNGVKVELTLARPLSTMSDVSAVLEGEDVRARLVFTDSATGAPLTEISPAAWVDARAADLTATEFGACRDKIQSYLRGSLQVRPPVDLNSAYVLALTAGNAVAVYDPIVGFNISKLYAAAPLGSEGEDWALSPDNERLLVTMPQVNTVAVVNTSVWRVQTNVPVGLRPGRIAFQPDGHFAWVVNGGPGGSAPGVTVIDPASFAPVQHIPTGEGAHEIAFSDDSRYAFVANRENGSISTIDIGNLAVVSEIPTGPNPMGLAWSATAGAVYVTHEEDGSIVVIDPASQTITTRLVGQPGVGTVAFEPAGRWGFAPNPVQDEVYIIDATVAEIVDILPFGTAPDQVAFTENFAYIRASGSPDVVMIPFDVLEAEGKAKIMPFETGQEAPAKYGSNAIAAAIAPAAHHMSDAVYVPNAAEKSVYLYHYMMNMPMPAGRVDTYPFEPKAVLVVNRALREVAPGAFQTTFKAPAAGEWDVVFLLDNPRVINCFGFQIQDNPEVEMESKLRLRLTQVPEAEPLPAGETATLTFRVAEYYTDDPQEGLEDLWVWVFSSRGWSQRVWATHVEEGVYSVDLTLPRSGPYNLIISTETLGLGFEDTFPLVVRAVDPGNR